MDSMTKRIHAVLAVFFLAATAVLIHLCRIITNHDAISTGSTQGSYKLNIPLSTGTIYDSSFERITNTETRYYAIIHPTADAVAAVFAKVRDRDYFRSAIQRGAPFFCELTDGDIQNENIWLLQGAGQDQGYQLAQHLVGYRQNGKGVAGLEAACSEWLSSCDTVAHLQCTVDAMGTMLPGLTSELYNDGCGKGGIVTTLDCGIQRIAEAALTESGYHGAAVVMDIHNGNICAMASLPVYDAQNLAEYLDDTDTPFLNRALCAYSVGSIFKLVIAAAALEEDFTTGYMYRCSGETEIYGQTFRCHTRQGHGLLNMESALTVSCNPYFISMSQLLSPERLVNTASAVGFGQTIALADGMQSSAGYLQTVEELNVEAEKANFSFGQGKLLATPLQIAAFTACIANDGVYQKPRLLLGMTEDGETLVNQTAIESEQVISLETAQTIREMMVTVLTAAEDAKGLPELTTAGGKTSTAQTGQRDTDGNELCHAWMTGFFPAEQPQYAVTVMIEHGGYGNETAAPVFRRIIDSMAAAGYADHAS